MSAEQDAQRLKAYADGIANGARMAWDAMEAGVERAEHIRVIDYSTRLLTTPPEQLLPAERELRAETAARALRIIYESGDVEAWAMQVIREYQAYGGADPA